MTKLMLATAALAFTMAPPALAAPCKDAKGRFVKCPTAKPAPARCRLKGKFVKCGTPGSTPA